MPFRIVKIDEQEKSNILNKLVAFKYDLICTVFDVPIDEFLSSHIKQGIEESFRHKNKVEAFIAAVKQYVKLKNKNNDDPKYSFKNRSFFTIMDEEKFTKKERGDTWFYFEMDEKRMFVDLMQEYMELYDDDPNGYYSSDDGGIY